MGRIRLFPLLFQNGCSQSSQFLPQTRRIVGSRDENGLIAAAIGALSMLMSEPTAKTNVKGARMFCPLTRDLTLLYMCFATDIPKRRGIQKENALINGYHCTFVDVPLMSYDS